jgi:hypothetical protein
MNENLPSPINGDNELLAYERYVNAVGQNAMSNECNIATIEERNMSYIPTDNKKVPESLKNTAYMPAYLSKHLGKLVRVECLLGNELHQRIGILMTVGAGFIVLRSKNNATLVCDLKSIRFVTIIHNNDLNSLLNNY